MAATSPVLRPSSTTLNDEQRGECPVSPEKPSQRQGSQKPMVAFAESEFQNPPSNQESLAQNQVDSDRTQIKAQSQPLSGPSRSQSVTRTKTPEARQSTKDRLDGHAQSSPGQLTPFDWDEFEARYEQALLEASEKEGEMLQEFEQLARFFNIWASSASVFDNERGTKRLQTRERFVRLQEGTLQQKKGHLAEVVRAFQSALALLNQT